MDYTVEELNIIKEYDTKSRNSLKGDLVTALSKMPKNFKSKMPPPHDYETGLIVLFGGLLEKLDEKTDQEYLIDRNEIILPFARAKKSNEEGAQLNE